MKVYQECLFGLLGVIWLFLQVCDVLPLLFFLVTLLLAFMQFFWVLLPQTRNLKVRSLLAWENLKYEKNFLRVSSILILMTVAFIGFVDVTTTNQRLHIAIIVAKIILGSEWALTAALQRLKGTSGEIYWAE